MPAESSEAPSIDTRSVIERRKLQFHSLEDIRADVDQLATGEIKAEGNWSPGQVLMHLARFMDLSIDGHAPAPWFVRIMGKYFLKKRFLTKPMPAGFKLPESFRDLQPGEVEAEAGIRAIRGALDRLKSTTVRKPHPVLGNLTLEEWDQLHCRHAELHLSFLHPRTSGPKAAG